MLEGLPELSLYAATLVARRPLRGPLGVVIFHHLGDLVNAARHALTHYFPISLAEHYLQNSSIGSPCQKWAYFTNEDFGRLDECLRRLLVATSHYHFNSYHGEAHDERFSFEEGYAWFTAAAMSYACCAVDREAPRLTRSVLHLANYVDWQSGRFLNLWHWPPGRERPPTITKDTVDIEDRSVVARLHQEGLERLAEMDHVREGLAAHLRATLTMADVTAPHESTLSSNPLGVTLRPWGASK